MFFDQANVENFQKYVNVFIGKVGGGQTDWIAVKKPIGVNFCWIRCQGGGAAGTIGAAAALGVLANGGAGGGSGATTDQIFPAWVLPETFFVAPGFGGKFGGSANGGISYVSASQSVVAANLILMSGAAGASGATAGTVMTAGSGAVLSNLGLIKGNVHSTAGAPGGAGGSGAAGTGASWGISTINTFTSGGAGGGGTSAANTTFAGGALTVVGDRMPVGGLPGGVAGGGAGAHGVNQRIQFGNGMYIPAVNTGGAGGGSNSGASAIGGAGGNGGLGSGGGGGGGSNGASAVGGPGGDGGAGYVTIIWW